MCCEEEWSRTPGLSFDMRSVVSNRPLERSAQFMIDALMDSQSLQVLKNRRICFTVLCYIQTVFAIRELLIHPKAVVPMHSAIIHAAYTLHQMLLLHKNCR